MIQRNIEVEQEIWVKLKTEAMRRNKNVRTFAGEILTDYIGSEGAKKLEKKKAIIIGAGMGTRLMPLSNNKPKCMLEINGKTILQRQMEVFKSCGITDISLVKGYKKGTINYSGVNYYINTDYKNNNILKSLFYAESEMDGEFIVTYSDILFEKDILASLLQSKADISLVVDTDWLSHYEGRYQHPVEEAEKVAVENNKITKIAKIMNPNNAYGEFIGLAKFSKIGAEILKSTYKLVKKQYRNKPFHTASSPEKAYLTDMMQELIDRGYEVHNVDVKGKWIEIDTYEDYQKAQRIIK